MRNCLIIGSGRSGTSMLSGILHQAGYYLGDNLYGARYTNPKGFFECREINELNEDILAASGANFRSWAIKKIFGKHTVQNPNKNQRWLLSLPVGRNVSCADENIAARIRSVIQREPFCYKDPRFSYTLPVWRQYLKPETAFLCVFREPNVTVTSMLKECRSREPLTNLLIHRKDAYRVWGNIYSHILAKHNDISANFFFVHYKQILDASAIAPIAKFLAVNLKKDFIDPELNRTFSDDRIPAEIQRIYSRLCELARYPVTNL